MKPLRILMLEDNVIDIAIIQKTLSRLEMPLEFTIAYSEEDYTRKLDHPSFDVILCDYQLPDFNAERALQIRNQKSSSIPFLLITGAVSEEVAIAIVKEGANDYILKDRLQRLPLAVEKAIRKQQLKQDKQSLENSLSEINERFQLAAKTSFDVIWDYDIEKDVLYCSDAIERIIGAPVTQNLTLKYFRPYIHRDDLPAIERSLLQILRSTEHRWRKLFRIIRDDGSIAWVNTNALVLRNKQDRATRIVGVMHDITEVRKLQQELVEREVENQRQITKLTLRAQEKERMEIGKELHDNVNQLLATAKIMIDTARNVPDMRDLCLIKSQESILEAITELRNLAHSMMAPPFENRKFEDILDDLIYKIELASRIKIDRSLPSDKLLLHLNDQIKLTFYRIIQEQLSNIMKHSGAKNVFILIEINETSYNLSIEDDGSGFDPRKKMHGIGLKNIESRCGLFGGTMNLVTAPGKGCMLQVTIPAKNTAVFA